MADDWGGLIGAGGRERGRLSCTCMCEWVSEKDWGLEVIVSGRKVDDEGEVQGQRL